MEFTVLRVIFLSYMSFHFFTELLVFYFWSLIALSKITECLLLLDFFFVPKVLVPSVAVVVGL